MTKHYTTKEIREFISCPQFGDLKYGKWGTLRIEVRETLLNLVNLVESMDAVIQQKENIIKEVREYLNEDKNCIPKHIKDYFNNLLDKEVE